MNVVMPPLLKSAQLKPDVTITSAESDDEIDSDDDRCVSVQSSYFFLIQFYPENHDILQIRRYFQFHW
jgi:hypothetical protein